MMKQKRVGLFSIMLLACIPVSLSAKKEKIAEVPIEQKSSKKKCIEHVGVYEGLGDIPSTSVGSLRRATDNHELSTKTIENLKLKWKYDVAQLYPGAEFVASRIVGPLSTPQVDEETVYFNVGSNWSAGPAQDSFIVAVDRETGKEKWRVSYYQISTQAQYNLAKKYPLEYDIPAGWKRSQAFPTSFTPLCIIGDYIITGDSTDTPELKTTDYFASLPQANGGPILRQYWGVTNQNRQELRTSIFVLNKHTGKFVDSDRFGDSGEAAAQGYCNVNCALRMPTAYKDPADGHYYVAAGCSITRQAIIWTNRDVNIAQRNAGIANGNRVTSTQRITLFNLSKEGKLSEKWRWYGTPKQLFAGDKNPYTGAVFLTDSEADDYNYHYDGTWGQRPTIDFCRRQIIVPNGNGHFMPTEDIQAGMTAPGTMNPVTGAQGYPQRNNLEWVKLYHNAANNAEVQKIYLDYRQTQQDRINGIFSQPGTRAAEYFGNAIAAIDIDTGKTRWKYWRTPVDTWQGSDTPNEIAWVTYFNFPDANNSLTNYMGWQLAGAGGDVDFGMSPLHVMNQAKGLDIYVACGKDGSMQGLNPDTGEELWTTKVGMQTASGALNYGATSDGDFIYANVGNNFLFDAVVVVNNNVGIVQQPDDSWIPAATSPYLNPNFSYLNMKWYANRYVDTLNELGGGAGKLYQNQNIVIPAGQSYLVKVDATTGSLMLEAPTLPPQSVFSGLPSVPVTSANDLLFAANSAGGEMVIYNTANLNRVFSYDVNEDVLSLPGYPSASAICDSPMVPAGRDIFSGQGDFNQQFQFVGPGRYFYCFTIKDKDCGEAGCVNKVKDYQK